MAEEILDLQNGTATQAGDDVLRIGDHVFRSRLLLGTSGYPSPQVML
ncbi:MAG: hypothetical protein ACR2GR_08750 [Rhodothermales bacterium]